jgi:hypothetical protein
MNEQKHETGPELTPGAPLAPTTQVPNGSLEPWSRIPARWALPLIELLWSVALSAVGALVAGTAAIVVGVRTDNATLAAFGGGLVTLPLRALFKTLRSWARRKR